MTNLVLIFWVLTGISGVATFIFLILYIYDIADWHAPAINIILFLMLGVISICLPYVQNKQAEQSKKPKIEEYSLTEWNIDYKIIIMGEKSDTVLVLTKIK